jgi:DNA transposition AAA+ family ATPase
MTSQSEINPRADVEMAPVPAGEYAALRERLQTALYSGAISQGKLAREIDYSKTVVSQFINGTYNGDADKVAVAIETWLDNQTKCTKTRTKEVVRPDFVETLSASEFLTALTYAQTLAKYVVLCGAPGIGKTLAAEHYAGNNPNVWLVTMQPVTQSPTHMLDEIIDTFNLSHNRQGSRMRRIGGYVKDKQGLLIIDEAQHLSTKALDQLRTIRDLFGCGIAVLGNEGLNLRLAGDGTQAEFAQLTSRIGMRLTRPKAREEDIDAVIEAWGITNGAMRSYLMRMAAKSGHLRVLDEVVQMACAVANAAGQQLGLDHLKQAYSYQSSQTLEF